MQPIEEERKKIETEKDSTIAGCKLCWFVGGDYVYLNNAAGLAGHNSEDGCCIYCKRRRSQLEDDTNGSNDLRDVERMRLLAHRPLTFPFTCPKCNLHCEDQAALDRHEASMTEAQKKVLILSC